MLHIRAMRIHILSCSFSISDLSPRLVVVIAKARQYLSPYARNRKPVFPKFIIGRYRNVVKELRRAALPCDDATPQYARFSWHLIHAGVESEVNVDLCFFKYIGHLFVAHLDNRDKLNIGGCCHDSLGECQPLFRIVGNDILFYRLINII